MWLRTQGSPEQGTEAIHLKAPEELNPDNHPMSKLRIKSLPSQAFRGDQSPSEYPASSHKLHAEDLVKSQPDSCATETVR